jgi:hypothetical protein
MKVVSLATAERSCSAIKADSRGRFGRAAAQVVSATHGFESSFRISVGGIEIELSISRNIEI